MALDKIKIAVYKMLPVLILICSLTGLQCKPAVEEKAPAPTTDDNTVTLTDAQIKNTPVETQQLSEKTIAAVLKLNGKIDVPPQSLVTVSVPLGGYLTMTKLLPGMHVYKGETIAVMEDPKYVQLQQDYLHAKSKLHFASLEYERQKDLNSSEASSDKITQQAQAEMNNQQITVNALAQQLKLININAEKLNENTISKSVPVVSSIDGFVSKVNVNIGKYVNPADVLFELVDPADIHLNLKVYENDVNKLSIGQRLMTYSNVDPAKKYPAEIILISKDISSNGVSDIHCHFKQYDKSLLPGLYMNAEIETNTSFTHAIPEESVVNFEGKDYVFVQAEKQTYKMAEVTTGDKENGFIEIKNANDLMGKSIVTKNAYTLLMKLKNTGEEE